jgi:hypothetical protein
LVALVGLQAQAPDTDVTLARLEMEWNAAHVHGDATTLGRILADDLVVVVPGMRPLSKGDSLGTFKVGGMKFDRARTRRLWNRARWTAGLGRKSRRKGVHPSVENRLRSVGAHNSGTPIRRSREENCAVPCSRLQSAESL